MKRVIPITVLCLLFAAAAFAQRGPGGAPPPQAPPGPAPLADYLGLTDSQKAAAEAIENEFRTAADPIHEQIRALHDQIESQRKAADARFEALLTAEQKTKFEAFLAAVEILRGRGPGGGGAHP